MSDRKLTREQYYHWRWLIAEMQKDKQSFLGCSIKSELLKNKIKLAQMEYELFRQEVKDCKERMASSERDYINYRDKLGQELDIKMDNVVIDEVTLEVRFVNSHNQKKEDLNGSS